MNTRQAREYFTPLTYDDLTEKNFNRLVAILEEHLGKWNRQVLEDREERGHDNRYYMTIHHHKRFGRYPGTRFVDKKYKEAFIIVKCDNYSIREGISFNKNGWIGFAGWSDNDNVKPFINAFKEWVDILKKEKGLPKPSLTISPDEIQYIKGYYVEEFPDNPVRGRLVNKNGTDYVWNGTEWLGIQV